MKLIALATSATYGSLTEDDQLLFSPLAAQGVTAKPAIWSDLNFPWTSVDAVVLRSCWDYHLRLPEFLEWLARLEKMNIPVWNAPSLVRWNADKLYLRDLEAKGIPIIPTIWPERTILLGRELRSLGWDQAVVKPRVSATAYRTCLTQADETAAAQRVLDELSEGPGALVQKFLPEIATQGEWSLVFFAAHFSHAVLKLPRSGDFRVQHDFGGSVRSATPPTYVLEDAARVIRTMSSAPLYARVDGVESAGRLCLMELELIEPALFLKSSLGAPGRFADAIVSIL